MKTYTTRLSSLFLRHVRRELMRFPTRFFREEFRWITGMPVGAVHVPLALLPVEYRSVSSVGVRVEPLSNLKVLGLLDGHGHPVMASAHSHPGVGPFSVSPSHIDLAMHRRFELAGYTLVGLIFSRDGWVRAFSWQQHFEVEVYGNGIEQHDSDLFRIVPLHQRSRAYCTAEQR